MHTVRLSPSTREQLPPTVYVVSLSRAGRKYLEHGEASRARSSPLKTFGSCTLRLSSPAHFTDNLLAQGFIELSRTEQHVFNTVPNGFGVQCLRAHRGVSFKAPMIAFISSDLRSGEFANCSFVLLVACCLRVSDSRSFPMITLLT